MKLTFVMLCYNQEIEIMRGIKSVLYSSIPKADYEIIVIDDGSADGSVLAINNLPYNNVHCVPMLKNTKNQSKCRNIGIKKAAGEYVLFVDGDDYVDSIAIKKVYDFICDNPGYDIYQASRINRNYRRNPDIAIRYNYTDEEYDFTGDVLEYTVGICSYIPRVKYILDNDLLFEEEKYNWYAEDAYFAPILYDNTDKIIPIRNNKWHYYCTKYPESNSNVRFKSFEEVMWYFNYMSEMNEDVKKVVKCEKLKRLSDKLFNRYVNGGAMIGDWINNNKQSK